MSDQKLHVYGSPTLRDEIAKVVFYAAAAPVGGRLSFDVERATWLGDIPRAIMAAILRVFEVDASCSADIPPVEAE